MAPWQPGCRQDLGSSNKRSLLATVIYYVWMDSSAKKTGAFLRLLSSFPSGRPARPKPCCAAGYQQHFCKISSSLGLLSFLLQPSQSREICIN